MILIEPMIIRKPKPGEFKMEYSETIAKRRDIWPSREEAMRFFTSDKQWLGWDPRSLQIYAVRVDSCCLILALNDLP